MNPEFLRQVCLHFSPTRVVVEPLTCLPRKIS
jgi:hypothetical protein